MRSGDGDRQPAGAGSDVEEGPAGCGKLFGEAWQLLFGYP
jgi:hypothetical protein